MRPYVWLLVGLWAAITSSVSAAQGETGAPGAKTGSGLPVPRFVSLKSDRVNVRKGPSTEHSVAWVFARAGLPVEVIAEFENWRQVRDSEGTEGWVFHSLLSGRRTALVSPWAKEDKAIPLRESRSTGSDAVARLESGVLGSVLGCDGKWCRFSVDSVSGWIEQEKLWGVYKDEKVE
ncbi:MAG: SH3 domain-containing protein [Pseudomonadota bacterium]|nr:SH3 domain-containing protein [Pseudomonadota bacterium]